MTEITVTGRVGTDPELRHTPQGTPQLRFQLAETHRRRNPQTQEWEDAGTTWRTVTIWKRGRLDPEYLAHAITKGMPLLVRGTEQLREWDAKDGSKGKTLEVTAALVAAPLYIPRDAQQTPYAPVQASQAPAQYQAPQARPVQQANHWGAPPANPWEGAQVDTTQAPPF